MNTAISPLVIGSAHVALAGENGAIVPGFDRPLTFSGKESVTVPPGAPIWSDPVDLTVKPLGSVAVSLYLPEVSPTTTWHNDARQTTYISANGNFVADESFKAAQTVPSRIFLSGIAVDAKADTRSVVMFGDSSRTATVRLWTPTNATPIFWPSVSSRLVLTCLCLTRAFRARAS